ncbi:hypothetical protein GCM10026982_48520 [Nocardiopsis aegyptia]
MSSRTPARTEPGAGALSLGGPTGGPVGAPSGGHGPHLREARDTVTRRNDIVTSHPTFFRLPLGPGTDVSLN